MQLFLRREACEFCASVEFELETRSEEAGGEVLWVLWVEGLGIGFAALRLLGLEACLIVGQHLAAHTYTHTDKQD